ncbi:aldo/keto reductase [Vibrio sp. SM6]|uniref:Aldo/keto reductase n=1 Tax=Vibrio agarilyticus TaxID=2726741 RepID=A0A7X8TNQ1_9VIBR|nr:aldo/keto reductase [Vibrio agarilyticus]NLS12147.1 aldo/keto reductase [Vibrio agarilyticus]
MQNRKIGDFDVRPLGLGCWAIGGEFWEGNKPLGWGKVDDNASIQAIQFALDNGINFIDTANIYGAGHSEKVIAKAIQGRRDKVILSSKFGFDADEQTKQVLGAFSKPDEIVAMCDASLRRLNTDYLDIYYFHIGDYDKQEVMVVADTLDDLVRQGKIRSYGWSTDDVDNAQALIKRDHYVSVQFESNVLSPNTAMTKMCEQQGIAGVNRGPLAMGLLSGKYRDGNELSESDIRKVSPDWMLYFKDGKPSKELIYRLDSIRDILTADDRSLTQGALAWLWANGQRNIPIPGFRTVEQLSQNIAALDKAPMTPDQMAEIQALLSVDAEALV